MEEPSSTAAGEQLQERLRYFAWRWFRMSKHVADAVIRDALDVHTRLHGPYEPENGHARPLMVTFKRLCINQLARIGDRRVD